MPLLYLNSERPFRLRHDTNGNGKCLWCRLISSTPRIHTSDCVFITNQIAWFALRLSPQRRNVEAAFPVRFDMQLCNNVFSGPLARVALSMRRIALRSVGSH